MAKVKDKALEEEVVVEEVEGGGSINDFIAQNQNLLIVAGVIIVAVVAGLVYFFSNQNKANVQANADMFNAIYYFEEDSLAKALNGDGINYGFLDVIDSYGSSKAGDVARYYAGVAYLKQGLIEDGIDQLEAVSTGNNVLGMSTNVALGCAYEDMGDPSKAASYFEKAADTPASTEQITPLLLLQAGRNYEDAGNKSKARSMYQTIKDEYPQSSEGQKIEKFLGRVAE